MKLTTFAKSLLPTIARDSIIEDITITRAAVTEAAIPAYESAAPFFKSWRFKSPDLKDMMESFDSQIKRAGNDNMIITISKGFEPLLKNLEEVEDMIKKMYGHEVSGGGLTYLKANLLQFVECTSFVTRYAIKFLNYAYICETAEFENGEAISQSLSRAEIEWLKTHLFSFCLAFRIVTGNPGQVKKQLAEVVDVVIADETADTMAETLGEERLDPLRMGFIPVRLNPIYHVRMMVAKWQADRYKGAKEELALVQLRKLNLEQTVEGKPDAATQKQLKYMTERAEELNYKLVQMEKDYA